MVAFIVVTSDDVRKIQDAFSCEFRLWRLLYRNTVQAREPHTCKQAAADKHWITGFMRPEYAASLAFQNLFYLHAFRSTTIEKIEFGKGPYKASHGNHLHISKQIHYYRCQNGSMGN